MRIFRNRFFLLIILPILMVWISLGYYFSLGKIVKTDNAYIKAPIVYSQSEISGKIKNVFIKNNQFVMKNQKLIEIDTNELQIILSENKAILNSIIEEIQTRMSKLKEIEQEIKIANEDITFRNNEEIRVRKLLNNKIINARNELKFYKIEYDRQLELTKKGFGLKRKLEEAKLKFDRAKNDLLSYAFDKEIEETKFKKKIAYKNLSLLQKKRETIRTTLRGKKYFSIKNHPLYLKQLAKIKSINLKLKKSILYADRNGFIANFNFENGEFIKKGQPLFAIVDKEKIYVEANFKETQITNFNVGQNAKFKPDSFPNLEFDATIDSLSPTTGAEFAILPSQNATGNWVKVVQRIPVRLKIDSNNDFSKLKVGMTVSVLVNTEFKKKYHFIFNPVVKIFEKFNKF